MCSTNTILLFRASDYNVRWPHKLHTISCQQLPVFFCVIGTTELHYTQYTLIKHPEKEHHIHLVLARYRIRCAGHTALKWNVSESATIPKKSSSRRSRSRAAFCPPNSASYDIFSVRSPTEWWIWLRFKFFLYIYIRWSECLSRASQSGCPKKGWNELAAIMLNPHRNIKIYICLCILWKSCVCVCVL